MPVERCTFEGQPGWRFGASGKCYTYTAGDETSEGKAKQSAINQGLAIGGGKPPAEGLSELYRLAESIKAGTTTTMMLFPIGVWKSAQYPKLSLTRELADTLIANFKADILGTGVAVDSSGKHDESTQAAGWLKQLYVSEMKEGGEALYADWEPTDLGAELVNSGRYRYDSVHIDKHIDNTTGAEIPNVLKGVTLTNTPMLRMLPPVLDAAESRASPEAVAASEPIEVALSELTPADPIAALIDDIDALLAKLDDNLKGKTGIRAMRTYLRETKAKIAAHTLSETEPSPSGGATGEAFADGTSAAGVGVRLNLSKERSMSELTQLLKLSESDDDALILAEVKKVITENATLKAKFAEGEKAERAHKLDEAIAGTHALPAEKDALLALAESAPETFDALLDSRKGVKLADLTEHGDGSPPPEPKEYADPSIELAEKAQAKVNAEKIGYGEAMRLVMAEDSALAERYIPAPKEA